MSLGLLFWIIMLICVIVLAVPWPATFGRWPGNVVFLVLIAILGWKVFGAAVHN